MLPRFFLGAAAGLAMSFGSFFSYKKYIAVSPALSLALEHVKNREQQLKQLASMDSKETGSFPLTRSLITNAQKKPSKRSERDESNATVDSHLLEEASNPYSAPVLSQLEQALRDNTIALLLSPNSDLYHDDVEDENCAGFMLPETDPLVKHLKLRINDLKECHAVIYIADKDTIRVDQLIHEAAHYYSYCPLTRFTDAEWLTLYKHVENDLNAIKQSLKEPKEKQPGRHMDGLIFEKQQLIERFNFQDHPVYNGYSTIQIADEYFARLVELASDYNYGPGMIKSLLPNSSKYILHLIDRRNLEKISSPDTRCTEKLRF